MELPTVDPMADDYLEQLFAWGDAFRELYGLTDEEIDAIEREGRGALNVPPPVAFGDMAGG